MLDEKFKGSENFVLITLDSCRWDVFNVATATTLKHTCKFLKAYTQATYTYPSHLSMYSGIFPDLREEIPYYNRFKKNLFRINARNVQVDAYVSLNGDASSIISGLHRIGYDSFGCGALEWFKHPNLYSPFNQFKYTGINLVTQLSWLLDKIENSSSPFFAFLNIGETHEPYESGGQIEQSLISRARMRAFKNDGFLKEDFEKQVKSVEFIDFHISKLFEKLSSNSVVLICGDHGECFGEDGYYGHGFYHQKVMEVPLAIFKI